MAQGDPEALAEFYDCHATALYSLARRITQADGEAEAALEEAMALIWKRAAAFDSRNGRPLSWAVALTRGVAIERARRRKTPQTSTGATEVSSSSRGALASALRSLPPDAQRTIEKAYFEGLSLREIAAELGIDAERTRAMLRDSMLTLQDAVEGSR